METIKAEQFYEQRSFLNIYYYVYIKLEKWITNNIFRGDSSRIFLASDEYAFRRRFELTDAIQDFDNLEVSSLRFPFANYWPLNIGWEPDDRIAALNAAMIYGGLFEGNTKVNAIPSSLSIPVTFYFDREDDARMAYDILYFKSFNEHYYTQEMPYADNTLKIPVNISIKDLQFNPKFNESDWLQQNRIFPVTAMFLLRTYAIQPPKQPLYTEKIDDDNLINGKKYDDGREIYPIVEEAILNNGYSPDYLFDVQPNLVMVNGLIDLANINLKEGFPKKYQTDTEVGFQWDYTEDSDEVSRIDFSSDGGITVKTLNIEELEEKKKISGVYSYSFGKLDSSIKLNCSLMFYTKRGKVKRYNFVITSDIEKYEEESKKPGELVGISW